MASDLKEILGWPIDKWRFEAKNCCTSGAQDALLLARWFDVERAPPRRRLKAAERKPQRSTSTQAKNDRCQNASSDGLWLARSELCVPHLTLKNGCKQRSFSTEFLQRYYFPILNSFSDNGRFYPNIDRRHPNTWVNLPNNLLALESHITDLMFKRN